MEGMYSRCQAKEEEEEARANEREEADGEKWPAYDDGLRHCLTVCVRVCVTLRFRCLSV